MDPRMSGFVVIWRSINSASFISYTETSDKTKS